MGAWRALIMELQRTTKANWAFGSPESDDLYRLSVKGLRWPMLAAAVAAAAARLGTPRSALNPLVGMVWPTIAWVRQEHGSTHR
jgi:hypothetical protein